MECPLVHVAAYLRQEMSIEENEYIFALMSLRFALMIMYFLVMNTKGVLSVM